MSSLDKPSTLTGDWELVRRMMRYVGAHKRLFVTTLILYPISAASVVIPPWLVAQMLDVAVPNRDLDLLGTLAWVYLVALGVDYVSGFFSQYLMTVLGQRSMKSLRSDCFAKVQRLGASYFDRNPTGRILTRLTNDVEALAEFFSSGAVTMLSDLITVAAIVGMMVWIDVRMTLFAFVVVPPLILITWGFQRLARRAFRAVRRHLSRINGFLAEHLAGMNVVQVFGQEQRTAEEFYELNDAYRNANRSAIVFDASLYAVVEAIATAAVAVMIWNGAVDMSTGAVGAGTLVAFIQYIRRFFIPVRDLALKYTLLQSAFAAAERIFQLIDEPVLIQSEPDAPKPRRLQEGIELRDVWFSYRTPEDWVLQGLNLKVRPGEHVALVGPTGSGKTTILKLLNRLYDVQRGQVLLDGQDVKSLDLTSMRRLFAVVLQDVHLFTGTVMENLSLHGSVSPERVKEAAKVVQAHDFIERLPKGYATSVQEYGSNFSAGERQLLAFARALAIDPEVLVLDEATSNVDLQTEARLQRGLRELMKDRTALIVAHRLSTVREVDRIVVLQHGHWVEEGNHATLMRKGGLYAKLASLQFEA